MGLRTALILTLASAAMISAEPTWKKELTSAAPGSYPPLPPSTLDLQISWKGMIDSGQVRMEVAPKDAKKPGALVIRSSARSVGAAAGLFPYQNSLWSELDPVSLKPLYFHAVEIDRKETTTTTTRHFADRVESTETTKLLKASANKRKDQVFSFAPVFDIFSAMFHVRSQKLDDGDRITLVIHPMNNPYLLRVKVMGREQHLDRKTIRLSVGMRKINRKTMELVPYKKMKGDATLWLSDDQDRIPLEFRAAVFIGDVRATLTNFKKS